MSNREVFWPSFLIFAVATWMAVYTYAVDPGPLPKWLQIVCQIALLFEIGRRIWRGRFSA